MRGFFNLEGPFYKWGSLVADVMILSFMWMLFSLPIVTMGAATSALFYVTTRRIAEREGYITRDFWNAFKSNFKRATGIWMLELVVVTLLLFNIFNIEVVGDMASILLPFQYVFMIEIFAVSIYLYPLIARFDMKWRQQIKSAFYMANRHLLTTLTCIALAVAIALGVILTNLMLLIVAMGLYAWLSSYMIMRVFKKYRPEMDKNPMLELQEIEAERSARKTFDSSASANYRYKDGKLEAVTPEDNGNESEDAIDPAYYYDANAPMPNEPAQIEERR
jgi:uncharacterized membrane protein YesL